MRSFLAATFAAMLLAGCGLASLNGSEAVMGTESHGTGGLLDRYNVWFLETRGVPEPIPYCVEADSSSPYTVEEYRAMVVEATQLWQAFFKRYGYEGRYVGTDFWSLRFPDGKERRMSLRFTPIATCDQPTKQLRFLFSPHSPAGESFDGHWNTSLGAAIRGPYDHRNFRTGGTVWVHSRPREGRRVARRALMHILLHEIGHVMGVRHNETWVMYENAADESFEPASIVDGAYPADLGMIELPDWRFRLLPKDEVRFSKVKFNGGRPFHFDANLARKRDLWRALGVDAESVRETLRFDGIDPDKGTKKFTLRVDDGEKTLAEIPGRFSPNRYPRHLDMAHGPGLFTQWSEGGDAMKKFLAAFWDEADVLPARGYFEVKNQRVSAELNVRYGIVLQIFIPQKEGWLRFQSEHVPQTGRNDDDE